MTTANRLYSRKVRAGLYEVTTPKGVFRVEEMRSPADYGNEWLWYTTSLDIELWIDPVRSKATAIDCIAYATGTTHDARGALRWPTWSSEERNHQRWVRNQPNYPPTH